MKIFINPSGFIEVHFFGEQDPATITRGIKTIESYAKKLQSQNKPILILEDVSKINYIDFLSPKMAGPRKEITQAFAEIKFDRFAMCAPLYLQVILTTIALVVGKRNQIKAFDSRIDAINWLLSK